MKIARPLNETNWCLPLFDSYYIERNTRNGNAYPPDKPQFTWNQVTLDNGMPAIKVVWHPNVDGQPGSHFFVQYRRKGETIYIKSEDEFDENFIILRGLEPNQLYEICAVVVDGDYFTESDPEEVEMYAGKFLKKEKTNFLTNKSIMINPYF